MLPSHPHKLLHFNSLLLWSLSFIMQSLLSSELTYILSLSTASLPISLRDTGKLSNCIPIRIIGLLHLLDHPICDAWNCKIVSKFDYLTYIARFLCVMEKWWVKRIISKFDYLVYTTRSLCVMGSSELTYIFSLSTASLPISLRDTGKLSNCIPIRIIGLLHLLDHPICDAWNCKIVSKFDYFAYIARSLCVMQKWQVKRIVSKFDYLAYTTTSLCVMGKWKVKNISYKFD